MPRPLTPALLIDAMAQAVHTATAAMGSWLPDNVLGPALFAAPVALAVLLALALVRRRRTRPGGSAQLADIVSRELEHIMIGSAETSYFVDSVKQKIDRDVQTTKDIALSAGQNASMTARIAASAEQASRVASAVRRQSVAGRAEADRGLAQITDARLDAQAALAMMTALQEKSRQIQGITEVIDRIAAQINLLALNAGIEAARAGEHGRGFAAVAGAVRQLAQRTKASNDDIGQMVRAMREQADRAAAGMAALNGKVGEAAGNVERVHAVLGGIELNATASQGEIDQIAMVARAHAESTQRIAEAIAMIRDGMLATEAELPRAASSAMALTERTEQLFRATSACHAASVHDANHAAAAAAARAVAELFEDALARGAISEAALFDRRYTPIPHTNPPKHSSSFDALTDRILPPVQEQMLADLPHLAYAGAVDNNGYFPTHNKKFSQPLTGDYDVDLVHNRTKRIFRDRTGTRCASSRAPFLLQTYKRDTGEVMHDLSVPIWVAGRHWGAFRIGYRSSAAAGPA